MDLSRSKSPEKLSEALSAPVGRGESITAPAPVIVMAETGLTALGLDLSGLEPMVPERAEAGRLVLLESSNRYALAANRVAKALHEMGYDEVGVQESRLSNSHYVHAEWTQITPSIPLKIRVSDHEAKPAYEAIHGPADFEVCLSSKNHESMDGGWVAAVRFAARVANVDIPDRVVAQEAALQKAAQSRLARRDPSYAENHPEMKAMDDARTALQADKRARDLPVLREVAKVLVTNNLAWEPSLKVDLHLFGQTLTPERIKKDETLQGLWADALGALGLDPTVKVTPALWREAFAAASSHRTTARLDLDGVRLSPSLADKVCDNEKYWAAGAGGAVTALYANYRAENIARDSGAQTNVAAASAMNVEISAVRAGRVHLHKGTAWFVPD